MTEAPLRRNRRFGLLLGAAGVSSLGDGVRTAALPLLAAAITTDPLVLSGIAVAGRLPWLLVSLLSGAIADRVDRARLMASVDLVRGTTVVGLAIYVAAGGTSIVTLYVMALILGVGETLFDSASEGMLPSVVPKAQLGNANGRFSTLTMVANDFAGPSVGSLLFGLARFVPFLLDGLSFFTASALVFQLRGPRKPPTTAERISVARLFRELMSDVRAGLAWVSGNSLIRSFQVIGVLVNLTQAASQTMLVLLVTKEMGLAAPVFGVLLTIGGIGAALGGFLSSWVGSKLGAHRVILPAIASSIPIFAVMAWTESAVWLGVVLAVEGFIGWVAIVQMSTVRQLVVPNHYLGRVMSVTRFLTFGIAIPVGAALGGWLASAHGVRSVYWAAAGVIVLTVVLVGRQTWPPRLKAQIAASAAETEAAR